MAPGALPPAGFLTTFVQFHFRHPGPSLREHQALPLPCVHTPACSHPSGYNQPCHTPLTAATSSTSVMRDLPGKATPLLLASGSTGHTWDIPVMKGKRGEHWGHDLQRAAQEHFGYLQGPVRAGVLALVGSRVQCRAGSECGQPCNWAAAEGGCLKSSLASLGRGILCGILSQKPGLSKGSPLDAEVCHTRLRAMEQREIPAVLLPLCPL